MVRALLLIAVAVALPFASMQNKQIVNVGPVPIGPFSPAVVAGGLVYVSGMLAQDEKGAFVGGDVASQTRQILERARGLLEAAGSSLEQAVAVSVYLKSAGDFETMNDAYRAFWPKDPPTRTTVITELLLGADVEISIVAALKGAERKAIHPESWAKSPRPYSYAIKTGDTVFLSGLVPRNGRDNSTVTGDIRVQTKAVMDNAGEVLKAAGLDYSNVVSARVFLPETSTFQQMNEVYRSYFTSGPPPARATVKTGLAGSEYTVEMTFVASSAPRQAIAGGNPNLSAAIEAGNRLYLSGVLGNTAENAGDAAAQTREVLGKMRKTLETAGYGPEHVVDGLVYLTDLTLFPRMNDEYRAFFGRDFPARATVGTGLVANGAVVEIMATAVK
jgi:2-iminobutanoate/2-iminopropanoate deaminase